ncbi:VF530 family protein [Serratia proteamaculans]|uniref:VF530 family protein n=1 Tax=Serratia proteamaculans TaxID=28151 RepID=UPI0021BB96C5|nr:VF530 family protein [Serratia proteamaculans]
MTEHQSKDPMHGVTLEQLLNKLVENYGWSGLAERIRINCFSSDPSIKSSLKFLRRTPWARKQVEDLYIDMVDKASSDNPWLRGGE